MAEEEELVDYEDDTHEEVDAGSGGAVAVTAGTGKNGVAGVDVDGGKKGSYVGIHSTGFRWVCRG